eukprot:6477694-Amphidinium_carterae.1
MALLLSCVLCPTTGQEKVMLNGFLERLGVTDSSPRRGGRGGGGKGVRDASRLPERRSEQSPERIALPSMLSSAQQLFTTIAVLRPCAFVLTQSR